MTSYIACTAPKLVFQLYGIVPVPAWALIPGLFLWDLYQTVQGTQGNVGTEAHIGGSLGGVLYFVLRRFVRI